MFVDVNQVAVIEEFMFLVDLRLLTVDISLGVRLRIHFATIQGVFQKLGLGVIEIFRLLDV
jgi:hypothetical protein